MRIIFWTILSIWWKLRQGRKVWKISSVIWCQYTSLFSTYPKYVLYLWCLTWHNKRVQNVLVIDGDFGYVENGSWYITYQVFCYKAILVYTLDWSIKWHLSTFGNENKKSISRNVFRDENILFSRNHTFQHCIVFKVAW